MTINLTRAGRRLRSARKAEKAAFEAARVAALEADQQGVPEAVIARELGVDRMTVRRKWLGKR
jgi:hypothetical protein